MGIGTFGSFTQARLAIYAAQTGLSVTGNNISNINTPGYTRQRLDQVSLYAAGSDRYYAEGDIRTGQGALVKSLSQIRSPYLDIRYRTENAKVGYMDATLEGLNAISQILDEVGKGDASKGEEGFGVLGLEIEKLAAALKDVTSETGHQEYDRAVKAVASSLITKLHSYANKLEEVRQQTVHNFKQDIDTVNSLLTGIRSLNEEIRKSEIHGDPALELRDARNNKIDELSRLVDINVTYSEEEIAAGLKVEKLTITLDDANPDASVTTDEALLIDGVYAAQITLGQVPVKNPAAEYDPDNQDTWPYLDANGDPTADEALADSTPVENPNYDPAVKDPADKAFGKYLKEDGTGTNNANLAQKEFVPNPAYQPYLDEKGRPTADLDEAAMVDNPNYDLTITELKNKNGDLHVLGKAYALRTVLNNAPAPEAADPANPGVIPTVEDLFANTHLNRLSFTTEDTPSEGDKTITIFTRNVVYDKDGKPVLDGNGKKTYTYTKQVFEQILTKPVALDDNDLYGELQARRELLTEKGEFTDVNTIDNVDEDSAGKRGIQYYQRCLDLLARQLANAMNEANQGFRVDPEGNYITTGTNDKGEEAGVPITLTGLNADGTVAIDANTKEPMSFTIKKGQEWNQLNPFLLNAIKKEVGMPLDMTVTKETGEQIVDAFLKGQTYDDATGTFVDGGVSRGVFDGNVLFSNDGDTNDTTNITALNISISRAWKDNPVLVRSFECPEGSTEPASGKSDNLLHMEYLVGSHRWKFEANSLEGSEGAGDGVMFEGCLYDFWNEIGSTLGQDQKVTGDMLETYYENALSIDTDRASVSSVDFNDEAMNLMMYAKSYNAACRLMTTIDSVLDKLINNTGMTT